MGVFRTGQWNFTPSTLHELPLLINFALGRENAFAPLARAAYTLPSRRAPMIELRRLRNEFRPTLRLAIPLVLAALGWMSMAIVDTMMVGRLPNSAPAIGAGSVGSNI